MTVENLVVNLVDQYKVEQLQAVKRYTDHYIAYDVDEDRSVTLDILRPGEGQTGFAAQFVSRARAIAQIRHPNITGIYTVGRTAADQPYVAQAAIDGYALSQRLEQLSARPGSVNTIYALKLVRQLADALLLATRLDLLHYDLRPQNVLLKNVALPTDDVLVLTDLFVPFERQDWNADAEPANLLAYLSPEQRQGREIDAVSHVYTLGVLAYHLLAAAPPTGATQSHEVWLRRLTAGGTALERLHPGLSVETYELVDRALRKDPRQRYESIEAFALALERALLAEELLVGATAIPAATTPRRPWGVLIILLVAALGIVAALTGARLIGNRADASLTSVVALTAEQPNAIVTSAIDEVDLGAGGGSGADVPPDAGDTGDNSDQPAVAPGPVETETPAEPSTTTPTLTLTPTPTPTMTATASATTTGLPPTATSEPRVQVSLNSVNLRRGPGTNYPQIGALSQGEEVVVSARFGEGDNTWYEVKSANGLLGWLSAAVVQLVGGSTSDLIPTASVIPPTSTPTPTPTATATPMQLSTETPVPGAGGGDDGGGGSVNPPAPTQPVIEPTQPVIEPTRTVPPFNP